jgi:hypothetical protein
MPVNDTITLDNTSLQRQIKQKEEDMNFYNTKSFYREQQTYTIKRINRYIFFIYHFVLFFGIVFSFFSLQRIKQFIWGGNQVNPSIPKLSHKTKFLLLLSFIAYPYVIGIIENQIYFLIVFMYDLILGNAFSKIVRDNPLYNYNLNI